MYRALLLSMGLSLLAGCGTVPVKYDSKASYAMNVARAANIDARLKDVKLPRDTVTSITDSAGYGFAMAISGYDAPVYGFSPSSAAGMNFAVWLFSPAPNSARNSLFAWMPQEVAGDKPLDNLADVLLEATDQAGQALGYTTKKIIARGGADKSGIAVSLLKSEGETCVTEKGPSACWMAFGLRDPEKMDEFPEVAGNSGNGYFFDPSVSFYSYFKFPKENHGLNELELLVKTSELAPDWLYFYIAPKKVRIGTDQPIKVPLVINQGKVHYFVAPDEGPLVASQGE